MYFSIASLWGFVAGTAAVLGGLAATGRPVSIEPLVLVGLTAALIVALVGGIVSSAAYREASRRQ